MKVGGKEHMLPNQVDRSSPVIMTTSISSATTIAMGRTRAKSSKSRPPISDLSSYPQSQPTPSVSALLSKAQDLIIQSDYPLAERFIQRILESDPNHVEAREMLGIALLETGELERAKEVNLYLFRTL
jgi:Flp pilus assembly protein TadD